MISLLNSWTNGNGPCTTQIIYRVWQAVDYCSNSSVCTQAITMLPPVSDCNPLLSRAGLTNITVWENTTGDDPHPFTISPLSPQLLSIPGGPNSVTNDFATAAHEYYDVFLSDPNGNPTTNGCCVTILCYMTEARSNYATGDNIDAVELDFADGSRVGASSIGQIQLGAGITDPTLLASSGLATNILGIHDSNCTRLGYNYSSITVCFPQDCFSAKTVECGTNWNFDEPPAFNSCCGSNLAVRILNTITNGTCPKVITRTWEITDCCSNKTTCSQKVTVVDTTRPTPWSWR
jgi:hypothetical protein